MKQPAGGEGIKKKNIRTKGFDALEVIREKGQRANPQRKDAVEPSFEPHAGSQTAEPVDAEEMRAEAAVHRYLANTYNMDWDKALHDAVKNLNPHETIAFGRILEAARAREKSVLDAERAMQTQREAEARIKKASREQSSTKTKPAQALDRFDKLVRGSPTVPSMRQSDAEAWAVRGLDPEEVEELHRLRAEEYKAAQARPLGPHYSRKAQETSPEAVVAGTAADKDEVIRPPRRWEFDAASARGQVSDDEQPKSRRLSIVKTQRVHRGGKRNVEEPRAETSGNGKGNGNGTEDEALSVLRSDGSIDLEALRRQEPSGRVGRLPFWIGPDKRAYVPSGGTLKGYAHGDYDTFPNPDGRDKPRITRFWDENVLDLVQSDPLPPEERARLNVEQEAARRQFEEAKRRSAERKKSRTPSAPPPLTPSQQEVVDRLGPDVGRFLRMTVDQRMPTGIAVETLTKEMNEAQREDFLAQLSDLTGLARDDLLNRNPDAHLGRLDPGSEHPDESSDVDHGRDDRDEEGEPGEQREDHAEEPRADAKGAQEEASGYQRFMNGKFRVNHETGKAEVIFNDGRRAEVEDGKALKFKNKHKEARKMVFDLGSGNFMDRESYNNVLRKEEWEENEQEQAQSQSQATEALNVIQFPTVQQAEPFRRIKSPKSEEFKAITDELAADTTAHFAEGSRLLTDVLKVEKPAKLVETIRMQLPKIAEVDRGGFGRIKLRASALATFEKGQYKSLKAELAALGSRFGVRAEVLDRAVAEKDPGARRITFRAEIQASLGKIGRFVDFVTATMFSRLRARWFDRQSRALYGSAESTLNDYRLRIGAELDTAIGRNKNLREFFRALLKPKKKEGTENTENRDSATLAA